MLVDGEVWENVKAVQRKYVITLSPNFSGGTYANIKIDDTATYNSGDIVISDLKTIYPNPNTFTIPKGSYFTIYSPSSVENLLISGATYEEIGSVLKITPNDNCTVSWSQEG